MSTEFSGKGFLNEILNISVMNLMQKLRFGRLVDDHLGFTVY